MTRLSTALLCAAAVGAAATGGCGARSRPNVLVLVMDTTRADRCSFEGYPRPTTPRLDEFAKDAVVFRDAWSPAGWTGPAHASLFTGLRPDHHGFHDGDRNYLAPNVPTLAEALQTVGYATGCFTNNDFVAPEFGLTRGFVDVVPMYARPRPRPKPWAHETHALAADWATAQSRAGKPFFLFVNDMEPHIPYDPPQEDAQRFLRGDPTPAEVAAGRAYDLPQALAYTLHAAELTPRQLGVLSDLYDAEIASLDREIGTLLDRLRQDGVLDSTFVVILGDHGELFGEHHMMQHGHSLHRAARRVPLLVRYPKTFDGGRVVSSLVRLEDVPATILELCGARTPERFDGVPLDRDVARPPSIAVQGRDPSKKARFESMVAGADATPLTVGIEAVYDGRFHFLSYTDGRRELYDESKDPDESENLVDREPDEAKRLAGMLPAQR
jgi:arylsulfatase A-like enzyme